jgi:hypothetical protein
LQKGCYFDVSVDDDDDDDVYVDVDYANKASTGVYSRTKFAVYQADRVHGNDYSNTHVDVVFSNVKNSPAAMSGDDRRDDRLRDVRHSRRRGEAVEQQSRMWSDGQMHRVPAGEREDDDEQRSPKKARSYVNYANL